MRKEDVYFTLCKKVTVRAINRDATIICLLLNDTFPQQSVEGCHGSQLDLGGEETTQTCNVCVFI